MTSSQTPSFSATTTPTMSATQTPGGGDGLTVRYYSDTALLNQVDCIVQTQINFNLAPGVTPIPSLPTSVNWSLRANGKIRSDFTETYTFYVAGDDGWRLWINGAVVAEDWSLHSLRGVSATVNLTAGVKNDIQLEYFQGQGYAALQLNWSSPSVPFGLVPQRSLYSIPCGSFTATPTSTPIPVSTLQPDNFNSGLLSPFWTTRSIGLSVPVPVTVTTALTFTAQGCDIWDVQDEFSYVFQPVNGDFDVSLKIVSVPNTSAWSKTGLMLRGGEESYAPFAFMFARYGNEYVYQDRTATAASAGTLFQRAGFTAGTPGWVRLRRQGNLIIGYFSTDGVTWTTANAVSIPFSATALLGIASTSASCSVTSSATVDDFAVLTLATATPVFTATPTVPGSVTTYREIFPNSVTYSVDLADAGWKVLQGSIGTVITPTAAMAGFC